MASTDITIDVRNEIAKGITVTVQYKNMFWVKFGFQIMKLGALISGAALIIEPERGEKESDE